MPRFAIATAFFLAAAGLLVSSPAQAKRCKPPLVCPTKSASKCKPPLVCPKKRAPKRCKAPRVSCGGKCQYPEECPRRARSCPYGTKRGAETKGLCCWPGQMSDGKKCIGSPVSCPEGFEKSVEKQACVSKGCPEGKTWLPGDHCCYPGSKWSKRKKACVGPKTCRPGEMRRGLECVPPGSFTDAERREVDFCHRHDGAAILHEGVHCCWPGQLFSTARSMCLGIPTECPPLMKPEGEGCVSDEAAIRQAQEEANKRCRKKDACYFEGACTFDAAVGRCVPSRTVECEASHNCRRRGLCSRLPSYVENGVVVHHCGVNGDEDCKSRKFFDCTTWGGVGGGYCTAWQTVGDTPYRTFCDNRQGEKARQLQPLGSWKKCEGSCELPGWLTR